MRYVPLPGKVIQPSALISKKIILKIVVHINYLYLRLQCLNQEVKNAGLNPK